MTYGRGCRPVAERFTAAGSKLVVAYTAIEDSTAVSIDWDASDHRVMRNGLCDSCLHQS